MTDALIDKDALARLLDVIGGELDDLIELLDDYVGSAPELAAKAEASLAGGDFDGARIAAHTLKSIARDFGATKTSELAAAIEKDCKANTVEPGRAADLVAAEAADRAALERLREGGNLVA